MTMTNKQKDAFVDELREYAKTNSLYVLAKNTEGISYATIYKILANDSRPHERTINIVRNAIKNNT